MLPFQRLEEFLVPELQATEEEKSKLESGLTNGDEPMDQDLSVVPTKCISNIENLEIRSVIIGMYFLGHYRRSLANSMVEYTSM